MRLINADDIQWDKEGTGTYMDELCSQIYPLTILRDRYTGTYSGGKFTAWNLEPDEISPDVTGDDVLCRNFWDGLWESFPCYVAVGDTIQEAVQKLFDKVKEGN